MSLPAVMVNIEAYKPLQFRHQWLMMTLASFSDRQGRCWPSLRTIADKAGRSLAWVSENLKEMQALGYFKRARKAGAYFYELALRFLPWLKQESAGADSSKAGGKLRNNPHNSQAYSQGGVRRGEPKENPRRSLFSEKEKGAVGRSAPSAPASEEDKEAVTELVADAVQALTKGPKFIRDRVAYEAAKKRRKFVNRVRGLACWVAQRWAPGDARWEAEALLNQGLEAGAREQTPPAALAMIDRLAELRERERG